VTDLERNILEVVRNADGPLKGRSIANRLQRHYSSHFRSVLARLKKEGKPESGEGGTLYQIPKAARNDKADPPNSNGHGHIDYKFAGADS
jgi:hypothetical protein